MAEEKLKRGPRSLKSFIASLNQSYEIIKFGD